MREGGGGEGGREVCYKREVKEEGREVCYKRE